MITFNDLKEMRRANKEARKASVRRVRESASKLLSVYVESLQFPDEFLKDVRSEYYPYVYIQDIHPRTGDGINCKPTELTVDPANRIEFILFTVTDDNPDNLQHERLNIAIGIIDDGIEIIVKAEQAGSFHPVDSEENYSEICEFIKENILMSMSGNYFGTSQESESVSLWD
ncbi:TPA: hypothetical protein ACPY8J_000559 [Yersinia enterocolitica]|nr:hypothetical protein [Yersinia enterocolitica]HDM9018581.1 hypothetical protein [Yersinia enterocolitica]HDU2641962.1 hypothetical protein [Yersinia enterocolitica]HDW8053802.1 hypothetical protein [Yersinia enterocolitica]HEF7250284.1 hypothetical protein [Yersinia enterocolitica]